MRKGIVAAIVVLSLLVLAIAAILILNIFFGFNLKTAGSVAVIGGADGPTSVFVANRSVTDRELLLDETIPSDGIQNVSLRLGSDDVDIFESPDDSFRVVQYGHNLEPDRVVAVDASGGTLSVYHRDSINFSFSIGVNMNMSWVELYIPKGYAENMDLEVSSGDMRLSRDLTLKELAIRVSSGSFRTENSVRAGDARLEVTSGELSLGAVDAAAFDMDVSSGDLRLDSLTGSGSLEILSGGLSVDSVTITDGLSVKVSSGDARLTLAGDPSLEFTGTVSSGDLDTYFEKYYKGERGHDCFATVGDGPYKTLSAEVTSGTLRIGGDTAKQSLPGEGAPESFSRGWDDDDDNSDELADLREELESEREALLQEMEETRQELEDRRQELEDRRQELEEDYSERIAELEQ